MKKFGLYLGGKRVVVRLVDLETGEIVAYYPDGIKEYLKKYDEYTLQII